MKRFTRSFAMIAALAAFALVGAPTNAPALQPGDDAPVFTLKDESGTEHNLADLKGKVVVLEWTNPDCPYVVMHYQEKTTMKDLQAKYAEQGVVWIAVNSTDYNKPEDSQKWAKANGMVYRTLQDSEGKVGRMYGAKTTPHMYIIDREGKLAYMGGIDDGPKSAAPGGFVATALDEVIAGKPVSNASTKPYGCTVKYKKDEAKEMKEKGEYKDKAEKGEYKKKDGMAEKGDRPKDKS